MMAKTENKQVKKLISMYFTHLKEVNVLTSGNDLISLGFTKGKEFKDIFLKILDEKLDGNLKTKEDEKNFIKNLKSRQKGGEP